MNYTWHYDPPTPERQAASEALGRSLGIHTVLAGLLLERGISTADEAKQFFRPQLTELHDPFLFRDMRTAVDRLNRALGRKERILVYGDYDVDGCTAVALVYRFLEKFTSAIDYYIPDRYDEGYGVSNKGVDYAKASGVSLIIVLDCGIKAVEAISYAKEQGIDFIICDHHVPDDVLPPAVAILNAKCRDNTYPYEHLSGCGVGFKLMQAFAIDNGIPFSRLMPLLDLCAVSIASDIVPILGENRVLAYHGLRQLNAHPSLGLKAILEICGLMDHEVTMNDIIFKIGPRINASGRMQNGSEAVALLVERDPVRAHRLALQINAWNDQRKDLDKEMTTEANAIVERLDSHHEHRSIVLYNEEWHKGIIGIVASRLTEVYTRPAVVLTRNGDLATGSARSVPGFDVYAAIDHCRDLLENFGGHTYAAGLSMRVENVPAFKQRFEAYVDSHILDTQIRPELGITAKLRLSELTRRFMLDLRRFAPFGPDNQRPLFMSEQVYDYGTSKVVGHNQEHIKLELIDHSGSSVVGGIAFGQSSQARYIKTKQAFDICYAVEENSHKRGEVQLQIEDIRPSAGTTTA